MKVLIISGGTTSERKISLISGKEVKKALESLGHKVTFYDLKKGIETVTKTVKNYDIIFPVIHGKEGEDGTLYSHLRKLKMPFVGSDCLGAEVAFNKILFKKYCDKKKIPTSPWMEIKSSKDIIKFGFPCVLKGAEGGSSREVLIMKSIHDLKKREVKKLLFTQVFVEKLLLGPEITVAVLDNKALPIVQIIPPDSGWFDYKNKYSGESREIVDPDSIDEEIKKTAQDIALSIHQDLKVGPYSRTDFIIVNQKPIILEINTPCGVGFTPESLFPKAARAVGLDFPSLCNKLIDLALTKP